MINIRNISIKNKLVLMQVFTSVIVLGLCCIAFVISDIKDYKERKADSIIAIAQVIGSNSVSAIQFLDNDAADKILSELSVETDILNASILDKNGNIFASYTLPGVDTFRFFLPETTEKKYNFIGKQLFVYNTIISNNEVIGTVCLQVELSQLEKVRNQKIKIAGLLLIIGIFFAFMIAIIVQRSISKPLLELVGIMKNISQTGDYKSRSVVNGKDEINTLSAVFNTMLEEIEKRDLHVKERTVELEVANKEMEAFSYSVSHDLRAPIRAINGFGKMIEKKYYDQFDEEGKELLKIITDEAVRMGRLIDDLLAFSRLGKKEIQKTKVNLNSLVKEVVSETIKLYENHDKFSITVNDLPPAYCDDMLIRQVFVNLISNALKYSHTQPHPVIEIGATVKKNAIVYYVRDNGVGFDMNYYNKLFGVFQRLHSQEEFEGTGIGLAIVQRIVSRHGGEVWAEGKLNEGAVFYFSLPSYQ